MACEVLACLRGIARDRRAQRCEIVEFCLVAQLPQEAHTQPLAVELAVPVEEMRLEQRRRHGIHRRALSHACHAAARIYSIGFYLYDIDARERRALLKGDVGSRETQLAAEARAGDHLAADRVRATEQMFGTREVARRERRAHRRA